MHRTHIYMTEERERRVAAIAADGGLSKAEVIRSVLIAHLRGDARATDLLVSVRIEERLASVLTRIDIEGGMRSAERSAVAALMTVLDLQPVTDAVARRVGKHLRRHRRSHSGIDLVDYVVAATAELQGAELRTLNVKHGTGHRRQPTCGHDDGEAGRFSYRFGSRSDQLRRSLGDGGSPSRVRRPRSGKPGLTAPRSLKSRASASAAR